MSNTTQTMHQWFLGDDDLTTMRTADGQPLIEPINQALEPGQHNPNSGTYLLRVGRVFLGRAELKSREIDAASSLDGVSSYHLDTGEVAIVETKETVRLPEDYIGIVFGTNSLTSKGLLVVNPGFITAGHQSTIRFFVVNFGRDSFPLFEDEKIARLLILRYPANNHPGDYLPDFKDGHDDAQKILFRDFARPLGERLATKAMDKVNDRMIAFRGELDKWRQNLEEDHKRHLKESYSRASQTVQLIGVIVAIVVSLFSCLKKP